ncbi:MAG: Sec-independent protein translocase subunit TatA/TatB [Nitrososphaerales archaeon]
MAWDDPVVWILIAAIAVFLFGGDKIPQIARYIGDARREFDKGWRGISTSIAQNTTNPPRVEFLSSEDPLIVAAKREGIDTTGKTKEQVASDLSFKLNKK